MQNRKVDKLQGIEKSTYKEVQEINNLVKLSLYKNNKAFLTLMDKYLLAKKYLRNFKVDIEKFKL